MCTRQTENSHVKTNLVHTLYRVQKYRVQKYGVLELEKFKELFSPEEERACLANSRKSWYSMPLEVFTSFIFKVHSLTPGHSIGCYALPLLL